MHRQENQQSQAVRDKPSLDNCSFCLFPQLLSVDQAPLGLPLTLPLQHVYAGKALAVCLANMPEQMQGASSVTTGAQYAAQGQPLQLYKSLHPEIH